jgi:hypothetical protein
MVCDGLYDLYEGGNLRRLLDVMPNSLWNIFSSFIEYHSSIVHLTY